MGARWIILPALLALLGGCASLRSPLPGDWQEHLAAVQARADWDLQGKIGVRSPGESGSAFLDWRQRGAQYRMVLSGALGLGRLVLDGNDEGVSWSGRDGRSGRHADAEALISELWGWRVPVGALRYWIRGVPDPRLPVDDVRFADGMVNSFHQSGWTIEPGGLRDVEGLALPSRVRIQGNEATLTVSISRWSSSAP